MAHIEPYVDPKIERPKDLPSFVTDVLDHLEQLDLEGNWAVYDAELDNLWVIAKNAMADGMMTKKDWKTVYLKYWEHEDMVRDKEREQGL